MLSRTSRRDKTEKQTDQIWQKTAVTLTLEKEDCHWFKASSNHIRPCLSLLCEPGFNSKL